VNLKPIVDVIIPAYNEEGSIGLVIRDISKNLVRNVIVGNNGSTDLTMINAEAEGAIVVDALEKGYGSACLAGMDYVAKSEIKPDIIVFIDGDYSDYPGEMPKLVDKILEGHDMVIGSRALGERQVGSMTIPQVFGNWLATTLIKYIYNYHFTDLGPFRAIKYTSLIDLEMKDRNFGWTVEMQVKAAKQKLKCTEVAVNYRERIGKSKVSGTVKGTVMAGYKILWTIFKLK
jgi:glycosyltransferase involved in cell wall biosynthesis